MKKINAIIIDDELYNIVLITQLISELNPAFSIEGAAQNIGDAYELIISKKPEVVFLDIKMPDGNGFALLEMFDEINFDVVFISGFDSYALKAFEFNALDYVLKPIDEERFGKTLKKVQANIENKRAYPGGLKSVLASYDIQEQIITKISVHSGNKVFLIAISDIVHFSSENGCTVFVTKAKEKYTSSKQLSDFDFILDNHPYIIRVNKGTYINVNHIVSYSKGMNCQIHLNDGTSVEVPRRKKVEILDLLSKNRSFNSKEERK